MEIKIWDYGSAFDLHCYIAKTCQKHNNRLASGRGMLILNKIFARLGYHRTKQQPNCLLIIKKFTNY